MAASVVVLGIIGRSPFAGVAWQGLHYLEGLRRLGHSVFYLEDTGIWPYDAEQDTVTSDCGFTLRYIADLMPWCGLADRWAYRSAVDGQTFGQSESTVADVLRSADVLINLTGATMLKDEHLQIPVRIYLETDPGVAQVEVAQARQFTLDMLDAHTHYFTFGENYGAPECRMPVGRFAYQPTRQPVVLDWWTEPESDLDAPPSRPFTTISSWRQSEKDIEWNGKTYLWSKHHEFLKFIDLPRQTNQSLELALACEDSSVLRQLKNHGWQLTDAIPLSKDIRPYRSYITASRGEFTVAKDQYVRFRSGWFSDRSASYLAAGRPVITQDTAFDSVLPTGRGLFAFQSMPEILTALDEINSDYVAHATAAREVAAEYFAAERVVASLLDRSCSKLEEKAQ